MSEGDLFSFGPAVSLYDNFSVFLGPHTDHDEDVAAAGKVLKQDAEQNKLSRQKKTAGEAYLRIYILYAYHREGEILCQMQDLCSCGQFQHGPGDYRQHDLQHTRVCGTGLTILQRV